MKTKKAALILRGGISNTYGKLSISNDARNKDYINFRCVKNSLQKHLIDYNSEFHFDTYIQSWNIELREDLVNLYNPISTIFEDNSIYAEEFKQILIKCETNEKHYNQVSQALSIKKSFQLVKNVDRYDCIIFYRPDVLVWKNIDLDKYNLNKIYCNNYGYGQGDFHFIMSPSNARKFHLVYDFLSKENPPIDHMYIPKHVRDFTGQEILCDNIESGVDQEVVRKLKNSVNLGYLDPNILHLYDISLEEINSYNF